MQTEKKYQKFVQMGQQRFKYLQAQKHDPPTPINDFKLQFPQQDFVQLTTKQNSKTIKLKTYRHKHSSSFQQPRGVVVFLHNIGMTALVASKMAKDLSESGFQTVGVDLRGHGKSEGQRGYLDSQKQVLDDLVQFFKKVKNIYTGKKMFVFGDGVGSLILLNLLKEKLIEIDGIILNGPSFEKPNVSKVLSKISDFSLKLIPNKTGIFNLQFLNFSRNPSYGQLMKNSPLFYHEKVCVGTLSSMTAMSKNVNKKKWNELVLPDTLIIQGQLDSGSDAVNTINFFEAIKAKNKQLIYENKMWHMFLFQSEYPELIIKITKWLLNRTEK